MKAVLSIVFSFSLGAAVLAQNHAVNLAWQKPVNQNGFKMLWFEGASGGIQQQQLPSYCSEVWAGGWAELQLRDMVYEPVPAEEAVGVDFSSVGETAVVVQTYHERSKTITFCVLPIRANKANGLLERLVSFELSLSLKNDALLNNQKTEVFADSSILATGTWHRLGVAQSGVFKITPQFLADCGLPSSIPSGQLRVYGNGKGMLPEANSENPEPWLHEVPLYVNDGGDGTFSGNDYALFYAQGPHEWRYEGYEAGYNHIYNVYADQASYFVTAMPGNGKRVQPAGYAPSTPTYYASSFDDFQFIEDDKYNLVGTGREWFGDLFDFKLSYDYTFNFANLSNDTLYLTARAVARATVAGTSLNFKVNGAPVGNLFYDTPVFTNPGAAYVVDRKKRIAFQSSGSLAINATYNNSVNPSATAWLDYLAVEARRQLVFSGNSVIFRDKRAYRVGGVSSFTFSNAPANAVVWDVTNMHAPRLLNTTLSGTNLTLLAPADSLRTFVALSGSNFPLPAKLGKVANQNLHRLTDVDMIIVAHPDFTAQAQRLADFHKTHQNLEVAVVSPQQVYNEFSSGMQDITAIKLLMRHLYTNPNSTKPVKYLLLFGDASYDYKNRMPNDHNFVPIYQSPYSFTLYYSFCTDDYFGFLENTEGKSLYTETLDIGIGRLPVKSAAEAKVAVDKIIHYTTNSGAFGDWRNRALFVVDDVDDSFEMDFLTYMDRLTEELDTVYPIINAKKIYADSYVQTVKAGSQRYPEVQADLFREVERGNLITAYLGHGGEVGWAKEQILRLEEINGWTNYNQMPVFTTVTCEFTRVDDPTRVSAGEQLFLNPKGGAVALFSTLRPVFATPNTYILNRQLIDNMLEERNGSFLSLGEVIQVTKNGSSSSDRVRFSLVGDPAMYLAIPKHTVETSEINGLPPNDPALDTLKALSHVTVKGHLVDENGALMSNFNGIVLPTVFDKMAAKKTLRNDGEGQVMNYETRENVIYRGKASVKNGEFTFEFVVPLDISFVVGLGKISYYATDSTTDAAGYNKDILVGGLDLTAGVDNKPPVVRAFINDTNFVSGGLTGSSPKGLALVYDENGINTVGTGIGHDLLGILDGNTAAPYILNDYFQADLDDYRSGTIQYPFFDLEPGTHTLLIRAWDVANNMGQDEVTFVVDESAQLALNRVFNYPNPFHTETRFQFEHNRAGEALEVDIQIYDQNGQMLKRIVQNLNSQGNRVNQITWDGTDESGTIISSGVYVYRVIVRSAVDGRTATDYSKLVYIR